MKRAWLVHDRCMFHAHFMLAFEKNYANKRPTACKSVDENRLNRVKADNSLMDRPRPSNTNFGESLPILQVAILLQKENSCT